MTFSGCRLGLLGGTFNPIHHGHLRAAEETAELMGLEQVAFIPAARPPHKKPHPQVDFHHRLAMTRLACADNPAFSVSDLEGLRDGPSYTVQTLRQLHLEHGPGLELYFITGLDAFLDIHSWKNYTELFQLAAFVVITRPGSDPDRLGPYLRNTVSPDYQWQPRDRAFLRPDTRPVFFRTITGLDISSTDIRQRLARSMSVRYLVPEPVREYIVNHDLYTD
jgi:nicotinate-nucleotide adenylyltransferase